MTISVLFVDDDPTVLRLFDLALSNAGFDVILASDGNAGIHAFHRQSPDIAVIDIAMPGLDGYHVIEAIRRSDGDAAAMPIIVLTAHEQNVMRAYALELGADLYLTKPVVPAHLIQHIEQLTALE